VQLDPAALVAQLARADSRLLTHVTAQQSA
jgi:hypothetical protein